MIEFHFALANKKLAIQVNVLTKDDVLYVFMIAEDKIRLEVIDCKDCKKARKTLALIEPIVFGIWEEFSQKFPRINSSELEKRKEEIVQLVQETKRKLYERLKDVVELKEQVCPLSWVFLTPEEGKKNEIPFN